MSIKPWMVIVGAGASFGSMDAKPSVPPLGYQLFFDMRCSNPSGMANLMTGKLAEAFSMDFEKGMEVLYAWQSVKDVAQFQREIAMCLLRYEAGDNNLYGKLINTFKADIKKVSFVSLNYDLLMEDCADRSGLPITYRGEPKAGSLELLKIHGSANFAPNIGNSSVTGIRIIAPKGCAHVDSDFKPLSRIGALAFCQSSTLAPAIAQYMKGKYLLHARSGIEQVYDQFQRRLSDAKTIVIIGVAVVEHDDHIWGELSEAAAEIFYVGLPSDCEKFTTWSKKHKRDRDGVLANSFEKAIDLISAVFNN